jgi:nucleotide-binding universal stress UspA family protein
MFSKILVGIDGSEYSRNAVNYALDLATKYSSELFLLAIVPSKVHHGDSSGVFGMVSPSYFEEYKKEAEKWFEEIKNHIIQQTSIDFNNKVKSEVMTTPFSTAASILNYAEERDVNLIIIGTRGHSGLKKMLLGSVANDVVTYAFCPVLVIK